MSEDKRSRPAGNRTADKASATDTESTVPDALSYTDWAQLVGDAIIKLAGTNTYVDADDIRRLGLPEPRHANWWGTCWSGLHRDGFIEPAGYVRSTRRIAHSGAHQLWSASTKKARR